MSRSTNNVLPNFYWEAKGLKIYFLNILNFINFLEPLYADPHVWWWRGQELSAPSHLMV